MSASRAHRAHVITRAALIGCAAIALTPATAALAAPPPGKGHTIPSQYIVVLNDTAPAGAQERVKTKARGKGARVDHEYGKALRGFSAKLSDAAVADLQSDPDVAYVEPDSIVTLDTTQTGATWGLDRIDQRDLPLSTTYTYNATGQGVKAYIIDTGARFTHTQFGGRAISGFDAVDGGTADDCNGHGTHVAGTVGGSTYGVAKQVSIVAVRVLDCNGSGATSGVIAGINWVTTNHLPGQPAVANMSLGGGVSASLDTAVSNSVADGVTYAVAGGNDNANACNGSPARVASALTVGATTTTDARASFSNFGTCLDLFAPGQSITSSWNTSDTATNTISGTSMATPHVTGVAALYLQGAPMATPATVSSAIVNSATSNKVTNAGTGSPNRLLYSLFGAAPPPPPPPPPPPTGCGLTESYGGSLSATGGAAFWPSSGGYTSTVSGTHRGCLRGPTGADFDLYLQKLNTNGTFGNVAQSISSTPNEDIAYSGTAGTYRWRVVSYSGSGSYAFGMTRP